MDFLISGFLKNTQRPYQAIYIELRENGINVTNRTSPYSLLVYLCELKGVPILATASDVTKAHRLCDKTIKRLACMALNQYVMTGKLAITAYFAAIDDVL